MALCNSRSSTNFQNQQSHGILYFLFLLLPFTNSVSFNFSSFQPHRHGNLIYYQGVAFAGSGVIQLTKSQDPSISFTVGRASYAAPIHLWDVETGNLTDFNTHFSFVIEANDLPHFGDGLAFFLSPFHALVPINSGGGFLGLFENSTAFNRTNNQIVAVEFDTVQDYWDPNNPHVGIDVNSIDSVANFTWNTSINNGTTANAWVNYNSTTKTLSVYLTYAENPVFQGDYILSYVVDLREILPDWVRVGFSASTGFGTEIHNIVSWTFNSTLGGSPSKGKGHKTNLRLMVGLPVGIGALICGVGLFWFMKWKQIVLRGKPDMDLDDSTDDDDLEEGTGPRRFTLGELKHATNNFSEGEKLGQGGFGGVYKGVLSDTQEVVAVKRISRESNQGKKEFKSEVKIISQLRHKNLVQLIGWCRRRGDFLLAYEFMPNGSLDTHLFGGKSKLTWRVRYNIALDLAAAVLYLHEELGQYVLHRDIKSSNIMLDSNYNAKLGDFGLARLVDHELDSETTDLAGTMGYLAPECVTTWKASKESDVYSFGVVALEIACGRKPIESNRDPDQVNLLEWVWSLYGKGQLCEAVDKDLMMGYDEHQVERLMVLGLWCCHPNFNLRPSIRRAFNFIKSEDPWPILPSQMPEPPNSLHPMCMSSNASSIVAIDSDKGRSQCPSSSQTRSNYSSLSVQSSKAPFQSDEDNV